MVLQEKCIVKQVNQLKYGWSSVILGVIELYQLELLLMPMPSNFTVYLNSALIEKLFWQDFSCSYSDDVAGFLYSASERDSLGIWLVMNFLYINCGDRSDLIS